MADQTTSPIATTVQPDGQGQSTAPPSTVQPDGQGQSDVSDLYREVLATVPEDQRQHVEPHLKEWDRRVNPKLSEAADYRKRWESFEAIEGLDEVGAEGVGALLEFANALADPENAKQAILNLAANVGVDLGIADPAAGEDLDPLEQLRSELDQLKQSQAQKEEEAELARITEQEATKLRAEWDVVEQEHKDTFGRELSDKERERLKGLAARFVADTEEPIKAAYTFLKDVAGDAQTSLVDGAPTPPAPAQPAGRASTTVQPVDSFDEAERLMRERRQAVPTA